MNLLLKILKIIGPLVASIFMVYLISRFATQSTSFMQNKIVSFASQDNSFVFDYPLFDGWSTTVDNDTITYAKESVSHQVTIREKMMKVTPEFWPSKPINPQGVPYFSEKNPAGGETITFRIPNGAVEISIPVKVKDQKFSGQKIWDIILNSFKNKQN